jgi:hypothetical protein
METEGELDKKQTAGDYRIYIILIRPERRRKKYCRVYGLKLGCHAIEVLFVVIPEYGAEEDIWT